MDNSVFSNAASSATVASNTTDITSVLDPAIQSKEKDISDSFGDIIPNETLSTNDQSIVGHENIVKEENPGVPFNLQPDTPDAAALSPELESTEPEPPTPNEELAIEPIIEEPKDTAKEDFVQTYTKEFDETVDRATDAARKTLASIDIVIREHASDIVIPSEANEFLDEPPEGGKVLKFDEARMIINQIMARAEQAKHQSEQAAAEAAQVYDEVQKFKNDTEEKIAELTDDKKVTAPAATEEIFKAA